MSVLMSVFYCRYDPAQPLWRAVAGIMSANVLYWIYDKLTLIHWSADDEVAGSCSQPLAVGMHQV